MQQVGKYEILSEIGRGAMGAVYKARDPLIGRLVALKTITSGVNAQANSLERFYQEARSAGALQHPNIVTIYELGAENKTPFIAMEYIEGGSLDQVIEQRQALPLSLKLGYIVRVCDALSYAHRHNVIHRDVKPANIMVTKEGVVKVVDFGIARLTDMSLTQPNMMIGSRAYMSPQLYKGERADARADIWAVGVTLYELLAYRRPFGGDSEAELMFHILTDPPAPLQSVATDCSDELAGIIAKMLEKKADDRYQTMEDVTRDLEPLWKAAQQSTVVGLLADSQQLVAANDLQRAQGLLRKALQIDVTNTQAKSLLDKVTVELRRSQVLPRLNEHLERGRGLLQSGKLREARTELEAALGLDSKHEPAQKLMADLEAAATRAQEVEQKLRLTKQRLAEGALTEAATALASALELDEGNAQAKELRRQIDEERNRREKKKKLGEVLHQARTLWTALNYEECLNVLAAGQKEFPNDPELTKLREMARHDLEDLEKQRQMGEVRKLLGQQKFPEARKMADGLVKKYPQDTALKNLQTLAIEGEEDETKRKRFTDELTGLRALLSAGKFGEAVAKGDALLREYPEEFELKELVAYARGEWAQLVQRQREKEVRDLMEQGSYREAERLARRVAQEFPSLELFRRLAEEAGQKKREQDERERAHQEMLRRIDEMRGNISQEKLADSIAFAQKSLASFGPHPNVTQLLNVAAVKQEEFRKKTAQDREFAVAKTMADAGDFAGATQVLNQAMATQIFERSDPRVQKRLREIEVLTLAPAVKPAEEKRLSGGLESGPAATKPAAMAARAGASAQQPMFTESAVLKPMGPVVAQPPKQKPPGPGPTAAQAGPPTGAREREAFSKGLGWVQREWQALAPRLLPLLRNPGFLLAVGGVAGLAVVIVVVVSRGPSRQERDLRARALQQWSAHALDDSEQAWRKLEALGGSYQLEAAKKIKDIEGQREQERQLFEQGETQLNEQKDYVQAQQSFEAVANLKLWLTDKAEEEIERAKTLAAALDSSTQEQQHFNQGKAFFDTKAYDQARKEFLAARDLNVPNSALRPEIDVYLKRMAQNADAKKLYEQALGDIKNEKWEEAAQQLQEIVNRKGVLSKEANQRLGETNAAQKAIVLFHQTVQGGAYHDAKNQLDGMQQWPLTRDRLSRELRDTVNRQMNDMRSRATSLQARGDLEGLEQVHEELRRFPARNGDPQVEGWAKEFDQWLSSAERNLKETQDDKTNFEAAVADFNASKEKGDANRLNHEVLQKFQKIAKGSGAFHAQAQEYVIKTIPATAQELLAKNVGPGKAVVPPINCTSDASGEAAKPSLQSVTCAQLDADTPLQWTQLTPVEFPSSASQNGKLPYTLHLTVFVDATGKIRIEKEGVVDNDFFKKAKDAAKHWKASVPKSGGKPVSVTFPLSITFPK